MTKKLSMTNYKLTITEQRLTSPVRFALLSDLHERKADDILLLLEKEKPDFICVAGDSLERYDNEKNKPLPKEEHPFFYTVFMNIAYYTNKLFWLLFNRKNRPDEEGTFRFFDKASKIAPVYMCLGNHEEKLLKTDLEFFREHNITILNNSCEAVGVKGFSFMLGGIPCEDIDEDFLRGYSEESGFRILLCHRPEYYETILDGVDFDLILSGHAHGGQIRINDKGLFAPGQGYKPKYTKGFYDNRLIVCAGCSNTVAIPRIGNPREVVMIEMVN